MAFEIDQIHIESFDKTIDFSHKEGKWSCCVTTRETVGGAKEESSSISACSAEDVIVALLLNLGHDDRCISVSKGLLGTWIPTRVRCYEGDFGCSTYHLDNPLYWLVGNDELRFK